VTVALGIDVGATKVAAGIVDATDGVVRERRQLATAADGARVLRDCVELAAEAWRPELDGIGIGICELVRPDGTLASGESVDWRELDVGAAFAPRGPVRLESDVRAAAVAEARFGSGRGHDSMLYVNAGSGVSHCLVLHGRPLVGARGNAIVTGAPLVEEVAGGLALARLTGEPSAREALGDAAHTAVVTRAASELGQTLATLVNAVDPQIVVLGGGLCLDPGYRAIVVAAARKLIYADETRSLPMEPAALGAQAGVIGAALAGAALT
jgi:glucokinase